jgi:hypothetical protein
MKEMTALRAYLKNVAREGRVHNSGGKRPVKQVLHNLKEPSNRPPIGSRF